MEYLFGKSGLKRIRCLCSSKTLFAFDFDGTLSKISFRPSGARIADKTQRLLSRLSEIAPLAIISGRNSADLKPHLNFKPQYLISNHGIGGMEWEKSLGKPAKQTCRSWKKQIQKFLEEKNMPGVELEDNLFTLAVHYRHARSKRKAKMAILERVLGLSPPPHIVTGKSVINIVPEGLPHKGDAFRKLLWLSRAKSAVYIGDDDTDENIFSLSLPCVLTARIGYKKNSCAHFFLYRQSEVNKLLQIIIDTICRQ